MLRNTLAASRRRLRQIDSHWRRSEPADFPKAGHASALDSSPMRNPDEADPILAPLMWIVCLLVGIAFWIAAVRILL